MKQIQQTKNDEVKFASEKVKLPPLKATENNKIYLKYKNI